MNREPDQQGHKCAPANFKTNKRIQGRKGKGMRATSQKINRFCKRIIAAAALPAVVVMLGTAASAVAGVSGAIFTTDSMCECVNCNQYASKDDVYLNGGPAKD